jgi:hypothetical protein
MFFLLFFVLLLLFCIAVVVVVVVVVVVFNKIASVPQEVCFHCRPCNCSICLHCKLTSHEGHETEDMATAARRAKDELAGVKVKAVEQVRATSFSDSLCRMLNDHFP